MRLDGSWWRVLTKCGPLEKGLASHFSILALRTPMNHMKRQKDRTLKDEFPRSVGAQYAKGDQWRNNSRQNENHKHRNLTNLITWTTALSNSMKPWAMPCSATQDRQVIVGSSDKTWSTGKGYGKPLQCSCLENPKNNMKSKKIGHWKMNSPGW